MNDTAPRTPPKARPRAPLRFKVLALVLGLTASIGLGELVCRTLLPEEVQRGIFVDERNTFFRYDAQFGWLPLPDVEGEYERSAPIHVKHDSEGFRDDEPVPTDKPTLLFVGDSMVWGFDVDHADRFTELVEKALPEWNVRNIGVSGFGTDQELMLLRREGPRIRPRHVFLVYCWNDREDNTSNLNFGNYYKPYFVERDGELVLQGVPVPRSLNFLHRFGPLAWSTLVRVLFYDVSFERDRVEVPDLTVRLLEEMRRFVRETLDAEFTVGLAHPDVEIQSWCTAQGVSCLDLSTRHKFPGFGQHWTPEGNRIVAARIAGHLRGAPAPESGGGAPAPAGQ